MLEKNAVSFIDKGTGALKWIIQSEIIKPLFYILILHVSDEILKLVEIMAK